MKSLEASCPQFQIRFTFPRVQREMLYYVIALNALKREPFKNLGGLFTAWGVFTFGESVCRRELLDNEKESLEKVKAESLYRMTLEAYHKST